MRSAAVLLSLTLAAAAPAGSADTAGQTRRLTGSSPKDTPTIHYPAQLWFAFARVADR